MSDLLKADLNAAAHSVVALEREQARLHEALRRYLPAPPATTRASGPQSHAEQIVQALLERIKSESEKPITLRGLAGELRMNAAYLSSLFARGVGVPFKTYLTELRIQKAKDLLGDFARTAAEVASATGYSSEEMFRFAFKRATGLSPKAWRETMQATARPVRP
ncbi:MAG: helix-turn-helix domain-containing protein [Limisphaerales bacterium]